MQSRCRFGASCQTARFWVLVRPGIWLAQILIAHMDHNLGGLSQDKRDREQCFSPLQPRPMQDGRTSLSRAVGEAVL